MDIQTEKLRLMKMIIEADSPELISSILDLFSKRKKKDFWSGLTDQEKVDIELGLDEIEKGEIVSYESIIQGHRK